MEKSTKARMTMRIHADHVLIPMQFRSFSEQALKKALEVCGDNETRITVLQVVPTPAVPKMRQGLDAIGALADTLWRGPEGGSYVPSFLDPNALESIKRQLQCKARQMAGRSRKVDVVLAGGSTVDAIVDFAETHNIDLIILGHQHPWGSGQRLPSLASEIAERVSCPLWMVSDERQPRPRSEKYSLHPLASAAT